MYDGICMMGLKINRFLWNGHHDDIASSCQGKNNVWLMGIYLIPTIYHSAASDLTIKLNQNSEIVPLYAILTF